MHATLITHYIGQLVGNFFLTISIPEPKKLVLLLLPKSMLTYQVVHKTLDGRMFFCFAKLFLQQIPNSRPKIGREEKNFPNASVEFLEKDVSFELLTKTERIEFSAKPILDVKDAQLVSRVQKDRLDGVDYGKLAVRMNIDEVHCIKEE